MFSYQPFFIGLFLFLCLDQLLFAEVNVNITTTTIISPFLYVHVKNGFMQKTKFRSFYRMIHAGRNSYYYSKEKKNQMDEYVILHYCSLTRQRYILTVASFFEYNPFIKESDKHVQQFHPSSKFSHPYPLHSFSVYYCT